MVTLRTSDQAVRCWTGHRRCPWLGTWPDSRRWSRGHSASGAEVSLCKENTLSSKLSELDHVQKTKRRTEFTEPMQARSRYKLICFNSFWFFTIPSIYLKCAEINEKQTSKSSMKQSALAGLLGSTSYNKTYWSYRKWRTQTRALLWKSVIEK